MKPLILTTTLAALAFTLTAPVSAAPRATAITALETTLQTAVDKRRKPRVPGGSGCDDPEDILEHPECG